MFVMMPTFRHWWHGVVVITTYGSASDDNVGIMTALGVPCSYRTINRSNQLFQNLFVCAEFNRRHVRVLTKYLYPRSLNYFWDRRVKQLRHWNHSSLSNPMMTSPNGNIFRVTGHLCGEFTGPRWIPHTKASDAELWCFLWSASEYTVE